MPSHFDVLAAEDLVPACVEQFGERDALGDYTPVSILLNRSQQPFLWPQAIVSELTVRTIEEGMSTVERESITIDGPTATLITGTMPLPVGTRVYVPKYGEEAFHPILDECRFGGVSTYLALKRMPLTELDNFHQQQAG